MKKYKFRLITLVAAFLLFLGAAIGGGVSLIKANAADYSPSGIFSVGSNGGAVGASEEVDGASYIHMVLLTALPSALPPSPDSPAYHRTQLQASIDVLPHFHSLISGKAERTPSYIDQKYRTDSQRTHPGSFPPAQNF